MVATPSPRRETPPPQDAPPPVFQNPSSGLALWAIEWLVARGISEETAKHFGVSSSDDWRGHGKTIHIPYRDHKGEIVNIKHRILPKEWRQESGARKYLYNLPAAIDSDTVIVVEGELDVLAVYEAGWQAVVSPQDGAPGKDKDGKVAAVGSKADGFKTPESDRVFAAAKRIVIATDADDEGSALGDWLVSHFGPERCYRVRWPEGIKDANQLLQEQGAEALDSALVSAKPVDLPGLITINELSDEIFEVYDHGFDPGLSTGWPDMDVYYRPMPGQVCIVTGRPSSGKSSWLLNMHVNMAHLHGSKVALFSPELGTPRMMAMKIIQIANDMPFLPTADERMSKEDLRAAIEWANSRFIRIDAADRTETGFATVSLDDIIERFERAMMKWGYDNLVIDPWNRLHNMRPAGLNETEYILDSLNKLSRLAQRNKVAVWIVAHPGKGDLKDIRNEDEMPSAYSIMGSSHWYGAADAILGVQRNKFSEPKNQTTVATLKVREEGLVGDLGEAKFTFDARSRRFYCLSTPVPDGIGKNPYPPLPGRLYAPATEIEVDGGEWTYNFG
jgi:twinkle protein